MRNIVALGATSAIVVEVLRCFASEGSKIFLLGRDPDKLKAIEDDLLSRGAAWVGNLAIDLSDTDSVQVVFDRAMKDLSDVDLLLLGYGVLSDQKKSETDIGYLTEQFRVNGLSPMEHCLQWAQYFSTAKRGHIAVIGSVAGDRGRQSNYTYGAAKGALELFLSGIRNRLYKDGVSVTTIKPGFVDTPMTKDIKKGPLFVSPKVVGKAIYEAINRKADVVYVPWFWRYIMSIITMIPEKIFKKLSL